MVYPFSWQFSLHKPRFFFYSRLLKSYAVQQGSDKSTNIVLVYMSKNPPLNPLPPFVQAVVTKNITTSPENIFEPCIERMVKKSLPPLQKSGAHVSCRGNVKDTFF